MHRPMWNVNPCVAAYAGGGAESAAWPLTCGYADQIARVGGGGGSLQRRLELPWIRRGFRGMFDASGSSDVGPVGVSYRL
ncbi:hypothetical protein OIE68_21580 [Nocardia vinacea]|uniref:Uncharacterized protein n=1 Tax=Nocardia vinacea TaxID=96468 RepID=A0ABZ1Z0W7_9NOCA|nr:hypothetical protein OIE68_21580 [Nocardia vinacea]